VSNLQLEYSATELLLDHDMAEPLLAGDRRCHGGFDADGHYLSPRTRFRTEAIEHWQQSHRETFGAELLHAPLDTWPGHYPNVEQFRLLLRHGIREPMIVALTRIGTVEGFGAMIRYLAPADMQPFFDEDIRGTAVSHLGRGLVEAHARDEAGWEEEAGHNEMWFAARDIAFEHPVTADETANMMARMGFSGGGVDPDAARERFLGRRKFDDIDMGLEMLISTMLRVLFIEIKAFHTFAWAEQILSDTDLVAGDGEAGRLVSFIRQDETPHVEYLRTALTEMRDRTFVTETGGRRPGAEVIGTIWDALLEESLGLLENEARDFTLGEVERALGARPDGADLLEEFHAVADITPGPDGRFTTVTTAEVSSEGRV